MARIVSLGSALQDIFLVDHDDLSSTDLDETPIYKNIIVGSKIDIDKIKYEVGGGGINSAVTFARCGHEAFFVGNIADDQAGDAIQMLLNREGINSQYMNCLPHKNTGASIVLLDTKSGERTILTHRGASAEFNNFNENILSSIRPDWLYVTSLRGDFNTLMRFFKKAHEIDARIMFNPGGEELKNIPRLLELFNFVDILIVNQREATKIVSKTTLIELLSNLRTRVKTVIITAGSAGGIAGNQDETYSFGIYDDTKARDATGAGDAFGSGFLAYYANSQQFRDALIFAAANSTSVISKIGANTGALSLKKHLHSMQIHKI